MSLYGRKRKDAQISYVYDFSYKGVRSVLVIGVVTSQTRKPLRARFGPNVWRLSICTPSRGAHPSPTSSGGSGITTVPAIIQRRRCKTCSHGSRNQTDVYASRGRSRFFCGTIALVIDLGRWRAQPMR